jgi:hypothetical protein
VGGGTIRSHNAWAWAPLRDSHSEHGTRNACAAFVRRAHATQLLMVVIRCRTHRIPRRTAVDIARWTRHAGVGL